MKLLIFLFLAGCAVKCDDSSNNYYVIEMPEDPPLRETKKPFKVYWNVPTMQCKSKKIPFENLFEKYGIIQNKGDSFRGEKIAILYDPGLFPALLKNESSGKLKFRNGGVPQEGDLEKHINSFKSVLEQSIPDSGFNGVGIIDFESWRPVFRQNFGVLVPYKDVSYEIERKTHWWWPKQWIQAEAKKRFEEAARTFMQTTISIAKQMRPNAVWGYYGFPYCFNMANNHMQESCAKKVPEENDRTYWLWSESTALYPSVYSSKDLTTHQLAALVRGRVREATRVKRDGTPILPYFWFRYRDGGFLSELDLDTALETLYKSKAAGFIIWGSSNDVNTVDKCVKLHNYIENIMGPAIAKYSKQTKLEDEVNNIVSIDVFSTNNTSDNVTTTTTTYKPFDEDSTTVNAQNVQPDPEFHWNPPENYTQDIVQYVEEELMKKAGFNVSVNEKELNETVLNRLNDSIIIDAILNTLFDNAQKNENESEINESEVKYSKNEEKELPKLIKDLLTSTLPYETTETTTELEMSTFSQEFHLETSTISNKYITDSPPKLISKNEKKGTPEHQSTINKHSETAESSREFSTMFTDNFSKEVTKTTPYISNTPTEIVQLYNEDTFSSKEDYTTLKSDMTSTEPLIAEESQARVESKPSENSKKGFPKHNITKDPEDLETSTHIYDVTEPNRNTTDEVTTRDLNANNKNKGAPRGRDSEGIENNLPSNLSTNPTTDQVTGSAPHIGHKYFICIIFYFYSVSKCLCDIYGHCS